MVTIFPFGHSVNIANNPIYLSIYLSIYHTGYFCSLCKYHVLYNLLRGKLKALFTFLIFVEQLPSFQFQKHQKCFLCLTLLSFKFLFDRYFPCRSPFGAVTIWGIRIKRIFICFKLSIKSFQFSLITGIISQSAIPILLQ